MTKFARAYKIDIIFTIIFFFLNDRRVKYIIIFYTYNAYYDDDATV